MDNEADKKNNIKKRERRVKFDDENIEKNNEYFKEANFDKIDDPKTPIEKKDEEKPPEVIKNRHVSFSHIYDEICKESVAIKNKIGDKINKREDRSNISYKDEDQVGKEEKKD